MNFRGLFGLTWLEIKIFLREPLGVVRHGRLPALMLIAAGRDVRPAHAGRRRPIRCASCRSTCRYLRR